MNGALKATMNADDTLSAKNLRKTKARQQIVTVLAQQADKAFSAEELYNLCKNNIQTDLSTVYRTLNVLTKSGLVTKSIHFDGKAYFQIASQTGKAHHHRIVCTRCKASADIPVCPIHDIEEKIESETGFEITAHSIELAGLCPECKAQTECAIRLAVMDDMNAIEQLIRMVKEKMQAGGNPQWDDDYPSRSNFVKDIEEQAMYIAEIGGQLVGMVTLNDDEYSGYSNVIWESSQPYKILHRLAVDPCWQGKQVARQLMHYIEDEAKQKNITAIRSDTFSLNTVMQRFFEKCGYKRTGSIYMRGKPEPFYCFEKIL